mmetsp:Transcript_18554/g.31691  ORF Transcript_18554/g.31691 Transcript_18554/m.31691 type:complete len:87 (+) Transcript_18554:285-545(+)
MQMKQQQQQQQQQFHDWVIPDPTSRPYEPFNDDCGIMESMPMYDQHEAMMKRQPVDNWPRNENDKDKNKQLPQVRNNNSQYHHMCN